MIPASASGIDTDSQAGSDPLTGWAKRANCAAKPSRNDGMSSSEYGAPMKKPKAAAATIAPAVFHRSGDDRSCSSHAVIGATSATPPVYFAAAARPQTSAAAAYARIERSRAARTVSHIASVV